jgi:hypothetical protein
LSARPLSKRVTTTITTKLSRKAHKSNWGSLLKKLSFWVAQRFTAAINGWF